MAMALDRRAPFRTGGLGLPPKAWLVILLFLATAVWPPPAVASGTGGTFSGQTISLPIEFLAPGLLLVSSRKLRDARFSEAVILLVQYDDQGAMGLIINQPTRTRLAAVLPQEPLLKPRSDLLFFGGPVGTSQLFLLLQSDSPPDGALRLGEGLFASASPEVLRNLLTAPGSPRQFRAYAGYAGWGAGQLEREINRGDWLLMPGDAAMVFHRNPAAVWPELISRGAQTWTRNFFPWQEPAPASLLELMARLYPAAVKREE